MMKNSGNSMIICKSEDCTGCGACVNICPKHSISMKENIYGESLPVVDDDACIKCGACVKVCPSNHLPQLNKPIACYAAWNNCTDMREQAASGGVATAFAQETIKKGGVVYGCAVKAGIKIEHIRVDREEDLKKLRGSKYVQSQMNDKFEEIKKDLLSDREVLFVGTPCQVAGLKSYLGRDYENLLLIDLICHGTPPTKYLKEYVNAIVKADISEVHEIIFRGKDYFNLSIFSKYEKLYSKPADLDLYYQAFLKGLIFRENCYNCRYAQINRVADITIGDFWGLGTDIPFEFDTYKVSVILVNSAKSQHYLAANDKLFITERPVEEAYNGNDQLRAAYVPHEDRTIFKRTYLQHGFIKAVKATNIYDIIRHNQRMYVIGKVVKRIPTPVKISVKKIINRGK